MAHVLALREVGIPVEEQVGEELGGHVVNGHDPRGARPSPEERSEVVRVMKHRGPTRLSSRPGVRRETQGSRHLSGTHDRPRMPEPSGLGILVDRPDPAHLGLDQQARLSPQGHDELDEVPGDAAMALTDEHLLVEGHPHTEAPWLRYHW